MRVLVRAALSNLAGAPVLVSWKPPRDARYSKAAVSRVGALAVVELDPELTGQELADVVLHEAAHVRLHLDTIPDETETPLAERVKARLFPTALARIAYQVREGEARELAERWRAAIVGVLPGGCGTVEEVLCVAAKLDTAELVASSD